jgi:hypothetical protein
MMEVRRFARRTQATGQVRHFSFAYFGVNE